MSSVIVPVYCGITGCWQVARIEGHDEQSHPFHACTAEHATQLKETRRRVYEEGRLLSAFWRENEGRHVTISDFYRQK